MKKLRFGDLFDYEKKSKIKAGDGLKADEGVYPFYNSSNVLSKSLNEYQFTEPSLIFGTGGKPSVHFCDENFAVSTDCLVAKPKSKEDVFLKYVYYFFIQNNLRILEEGFRGAGLKHISRRYIDDLKIPLPPLKTQKQIANILDNAVALRDKTQQLLREYDLLAQSIFLEMFGDVINNSKEWDFYKLNDLCDVGSSKRVFVKELVEKGIPFYRGKEIGELSMGKSIESRLFITKKHYEDLSKSSGIPKIGDLLMPSICPDGRILVVKDEEPFYFKDGRVLWIKVDNKKLDSYYLKFYLKELFRVSYSNIASGTTFAELKIVSLKNIKTLVPPIALQTEFAEKIFLIEEQKALAKQELEESEDLFNCLLQKAFKGELV